MRSCKTTRRSNNGTMSSVLFLIGIMITLLFACIAVDVAHFVSASTEMQSVADAAALMACYDLQWESTDSQINQANADATYMVQHATADLYSPSGVSIPTVSVNVTFSSLNGGTNNAVTVSLSPPIVYLFAPVMIQATNNLVGARATAERLPVATGPAPPWYLETTEQAGPPGPSPLPSSSPPPPSNFPTTGYVTFTDVKGGTAGMAPPIVPTYWVDLGITSLSNASPNPPGIESVLNSMGVSIAGDPNSSATNPIAIGAGTIDANHGSYNSNVSSPNSNSAAWTSGATVLLPVSTNNIIDSVYAVKLTGPYVPHSYTNGQGVFGEFGVTFVNQADTVPGVTVFDPTSGASYSNVGATVAALVN
ncbi:MAG TPA: pilus assembly protein TadG-related protein [Planktothrix sp.]|jgi:Flp pilus assembly protein TadG